MSHLKRIAIMTSGGDAPGMNAAIRAIARTAIYNNLQVFGFRRGYQGILDKDYVEMSARDVSNILQRGGTILGSSRCKAFREEAGRQQAATNLEHLGIDALFIIGGNGSMGATGASGFSSAYAASRSRISPSHASSCSWGRALSARNAPTIPAVHCATTSSGHETINIGAPISGMRRRLESAAGRDMRQILTAKKAPACYHRWSGRRRGPRMARCRQARRFFLLHLGVDEEADRTTFRRSYENRTEPVSWLSAGLATQGDSRLEFEFVETGQRASGDHGLAVA